MKTMAMAGSRRWRRLFRRRRGCWRRRRHRRGSQSPPQVSRKDKGQQGEEEKEAGDVKAPVMMQRLARRARLAAVMALVGMVMVFAHLEEIGTRAGHRGASDQRVHHLAGLAQAVHQVFAVGDAQQRVDLLCHDRHAEGLGQEIVEAGLACLRGQFLVEQAADEDVFRVGERRARFSSSTRARCRRACCSR